MTDEESREVAHETGQIQITIGGEAYVLKRTLGALAGVNRLPGGLQNPLNANSSTVMSRLLGRDIDTMAAVIRLGCGVAPGAYKGLEEAIFNEGIDDMVPKISEYVYMLRTKPGEPIPGTVAWQAEMDRLAAEEAKGGDGEAKKVPPQNPSASPNTSTNSSESRAEG